MKDLSPISAGCVESATPRRASGGSLVLRVSLDKFPFNKERGAPHRSPRLNEIECQLSEMSLTSSTVVVSWEDGLKLRPPAKLIRVAQRFRSSIVLRCGDTISDVRSIMSVLMMCATMGSVVCIEATGEDEEVAIQAISQVFSSGDGDPD